MGDWGIGIGGRRLLLSFNLISLLRGRDSLMRIAVLFNDGIRAIMDIGALIDGFMYEMR